MINDLNINNERLKKQLDFIIEVDKLKQIYRQTLLMDGSRNENDAEHSWHLALMAMLLSEHANGGNIDMSKVIKMVLIHDIIEIDAGDTFAYDKKGNEDKYERENIAADRLFNILPEDQAIGMRELWEEFEEKNTPEAKFAASLDRLQPMICNYLTNGHTWQKHNVRKPQVLERNGHIQNGSTELWRFGEKLINKAVKKGFMDE